MATISINDLDLEPTAHPTLDTTDEVKGGKGKQEAYLTYTLEDTIISSYS